LHFNAQKANVQLPLLILVYWIKSTRVTFDC
jgi:hypothetical protein